MRRRWMEIGRAALAQPWLGSAAVLAALVLSLPALRAPLIADDFIHRVRLSAELHFAGFDEHPLDLFVFGSGEPEQRRQLMEEGAFAWWTAEGFKMAFWRPLSVLTHLVDHRLWPDSSALMHAHNLLWFALLLVVAGRLYRRFHSPPAAALALLLYAVDDARGMVLGFVANRNALIAAVLGMAALLAHDRWRRDASRGAGLAAPVLLALALLGGESALAVAAYLFAYALFIERGALLHRLATLSRYAAVVAAWSIAYRSMGYGTHASGIYMHPADEPLRFLEALLVRAPVLLLGQIGLPPSDIWVLLSDAGRVILWLAAVACLAALGFAARGLLRTSAVARFWAGGSLLAVVPICATFPSDRLLVFVGLGAMALAAMWLGERAGQAGRAARAAAAAAVAVHLVLAPLLLPLRALTTRSLAAAADRIEASLP